METTDNVLSEDLDNSNIPTPNRIYITIPDSPKITKSLDIDLKKCNFNDEPKLNMSKDYNNNDIIVYENKGYVNNNRKSIFKCRICLESEEPDNPLRSPCRCKGTVGLMHSSCLREWIKISGTNICEICKCQYEMKQKRPNFKLWLEDILKDKSCIGDIICLILLIPCTIAAVFFCIKAALVLWTIDYNYGDKSANWKAMGLIGLGLLLTFCLSVWLSFTCKHYIQSFTEFRGSVMRYSIVNRRKTVLVPVTQV